MRRNEEHVLCFTAFFFLEVQTWRVYIISSFTCFTVLISTIPLVEGQEEMTPGVFASDPPPQCVSQQSVVMLVR